MKKILIHLPLFILLIVFACDEKDPQSSSIDCNTGTYVEGCEIESTNQMLEFEYCYPSNLIGDKFSLSDHVGKVFMIEMSASWWGPCYASIPEGEEIYQYWEDNQYVKIIHVLDDIGQPTSCEGWGDAGTAGIPPIIDGTSIIGNSLIRDLFPPAPASGALYPITIFINHEMEIENIYHVALEKEDVDYLIQSMLDAMWWLSHEENMSFIIDENFSKF